VSLFATGLITPAGDICHPFELSKCGTNTGLLELPSALLCEGVRTNTLPVLITQTRLNVVAVREPFLAPITSDQ
jgi:hypothetical protein